MLGVPRLHTYVSLSFDCMYLMLQDRPVIQAPVASDLRPYVRGV
jgi:hypothetical protein